MRQSVDNLGMRFFKNIAMPSVRALIGFFESIAEPRPFQVLEPPAPVLVDSVRVPGFPPEPTPEGLVQKYTDYISSRLKEVLHPEVKPGSVLYDCTKKSDQKALEFRQLQIDAYRAITPEVLARKALDGDPKEFSEFGRVFKAIVDEVKREILNSKDLGNKLIFFLEVLTCADKNNDVATAHALYVALRMDGRVDENLLPYGKQYDIGFLATTYRNQRIVDRVSHIPSVPDLLKTFELQSGANRSLELKCDCLLPFLIFQACMNVSPQPISAA